MGSVTHIQGNAKVAIQNITVKPVQVAILHSFFFILKKSRATVYVSTREKERNSNKSIWQVLHKSDQNMQVL